MAYLVRGRTYGSYYDVKFGKKEPNTFSAVYLGVDSAEDAAEIARESYQSFDKQTAMIDSVEFISESGREFTSPIDWEKPWYEQRLVAFDVETTGFSPVTERIAEIAFSVFDLETKSFGEPASYFINDGVPMSDGASAVNHITQDMMDGQPSFKELLPEFKAKYVTPETIFVAHNRSFDMSFWLNSSARAGEVISQPCWCSMEMAIRTPVGQKANKLIDVAHALEVEGQNTHRAGDDAQLAGDVFLALARRNKFFHTASTRDVMNYFDHNPTMEGYGRFGF